MCHAQSTYQTGMSTSLPCFTEPCFIWWAVSLGRGKSLQNSCRGYYVPCNRLLHFSLTAHQSKALLGRGGVDAEWDYSRTYVNGYLSTTATPTNACPQLANCQNNLLTTGSFFSATDEKVRNVHEWIRMTLLWSIAATVFWFVFSCILLQ